MFGSHSIGPRQWIYLQTSFQLWGGLTQSTGYLLASHGHTHIKIFFAIYHLIHSNTSQNIDNCFDLSFSLCQNDKFSKKSKLADILEIQFSKKIMIKLRFLKNKFLNLKS